jgi:hypothetical protein
MNEDDLDKFDDDDKKKSDKKQKTYTFRHKTSGKKWCRQLRHTRILMNGS